MKLRAFTLIELLVTTTIVILMAVIAIPSFNKNQSTVELQNKADEIKAGLDEMQLKALNPEQGVTRYYAKMLTASTSKKVEYGSYDGSASIVYKTINLTTDQTLTKKTSGLKIFLVCDKGKSFCCSTNTSSTPCVTIMNDASFFTISNSKKTFDFKIFANPFRVTTTVN